MFASWLVELIAALTPAERTHNTWAERDGEKRAPDPDDENNERSENSSGSVARKTSRPPHP